MVDCLEAITTFSPLSEEIAEKWKVLWPQPAVTQNRGSRLIPRDSRRPAADNFLHCGNFMILSIF
ncbi:MAG: hypothetical protein A2139_07175 [Desulfobacca sp. RBG_16_60_12]|nr:MAG: hypothetical protein A2139_07175 [Desulfobacca sp. RBG_16_60_12]